METGRVGKRVLKPFGRVFHEHAFYHARFRPSGGIHAQFDLRRFAPERPFLRIPESGKQDQKGRRFPVRTSSRAPRVSCGEPEFHGFSSRPAKRSELRSCLHPSGRRRLNAGLCPSPEK